MDIKTNEDLLRIWSSPAGIDTPPADEAFRRFAETTGISERARARRNYIIGTLVALLILAPAAFFLGHRSVREEPAAPEAEYVEFYSGSCHREAIELPDGSKVLLNSGSRLIYPSFFSKNERKVFLYGEAYFDISRNEECPFRVCSGNIDVKVLGTRFNFSAYDDLRYVSVSLLEGSLDVGINSRGGERILMVPGEVVRYDKSDGTLERSNQMAESFLYWKDGYFYFHKQPLREIASQYERAFGVKIVIGSPGLGDKEFNVAFVNGESLDTMLSAIARIGDFRMRKESGYILLTAK